MPETIIIQGDHDPRVFELHDDRDQIERVSQDLLFIDLKTKADILSDGSEVVQQAGDGDLNKGRGVDVDIDPLDDRDIPKRVQA